MTALRRTVPMRSANLIPLQGDDMTASQNAPAVIGDTISVPLKSANILELERLSKVTGMSVSAIANYAVELWLTIEAPVYLAHAKEQG